MAKKLLCLLLCFVFLAVVGCSKAPEGLSVERGDEPTNSDASKAPALAKNPLTGIKQFENGEEKNRPVAITVNNISIAQGVQTGLCDADIVYETEVEGGITRLVAVFQDVSKVEKIGTVRSARYPFIDLALGHNAIYVHHGQDPLYATPHLAHIDHFTVDEKGLGGQRIKNNLSKEHTLYAIGGSLWELLKEKFNTKNENSNPWLTFAREDEPVSFESPAVTVNVPFSNSYRTTFMFNAETGEYERYFNGIKRTDYYTQKAVSFKNVFILLTSIQYYPDGYHKLVSLNSGEGYYCVNGTYIPIKWSKGNSKNGFIFTKADGSELTVNPGNSWVCIPNKSFCNPTFQ